LSTEDARKDLCLPIVGALVDEDAGGAFHLAGPQVTLPSSDLDLSVRLANGTDYARSYVGFVYSAKVEAFKPELV
jgi:hypothetical protein